MAEDRNTTKAASSMSEDDTIEAADTLRPTANAENPFAASASDTMTETSGDTWENADVVESEMVGGSRDRAYGVGGMTPETASDLNQARDTAMPGYTASASTNGNGAHSLKEQAAQKGHELLEKGKETAGQALDRAKAEAKSRISDQKEHVTEHLQSATRALETTGQQFRDQNLGVVADYAESFAGQVRRASEYLREKDLDEVGRDVETFAKANPAVFLGGAFLLGIALARFVRSSESGTPLGAFSRNQAMIPTGSTAMTNANEPFGNRPLTAHDYVPGYGVASMERPASA